ncbi:MAG: hypothetical protein ACYTHK_14705 [Planctomycetota bacterium]
MRWILGLAILVGIAPALHAQEPAGEEKQDPPKEGEEKKAEETPQEPKAFVLSEKDRKKVEKELNAFLVPSKKGRAEMARGLEKLDKKPIDGHSFMEDVTALTEISNHSRVFGSKAGRAGSVRSVDVPPEVHGFPGGVGTVKYWIRLPKGYRDKQLWPVIFCLPDAKAFPDTAKYIKDVWMKSATAKEKYIVVAPTPAAKGKRWRTDPTSYARAMITLRHVLGTFDADRKTGGPASDYLRVFVDGEDMAAIVAARFSEMFAGAVLRGATGTVGRVKLRAAGGLNRLPAYCVIKPGKGPQQKFVGILRADNAATVAVESEDSNAADPEAIVQWMEGLPKRTAPRSITYTIHDSSFQRHHWINVLRFDGSRKDPVAFDATCDRINNVVTINSNGLIQFEVSLNDALVDLNRVVTINVVEGDKTYEAWKGKLTRDLGAMLIELVESNQPWRVYPSRVSIDMPAIRAAAAEAEAEKKAEEAAKEETEKKGASVEITGGSLDR